MYRLMGIVVAGLAVMVTGADGFARGGPGGGSGGGGQQGMRDMSGAGQYGYGGQTGAMQQQLMLQNRYRMMQSQSGVGNGNLQTQARLMNGANAGQMNAQGRQAMQGNLRAGGAGQNGVMQQQRLRDGSGAGQGGSGQAAGAGQMMQNRQRMGQSGNGTCPNR
jgi:hypothetical protein